jgi:hypothetical protein
MRVVITATVIALCLGGCGMDPMWTAPDGSPPAAPLEPAAAAYANPVFIPVADSQCAWETVVGVIGAYFRIKEEEPVRLAGNVWIEGKITTYPEVSPTIFEPWRHDTVDRDQRIENTLQSMHRLAVVRVIPAQGGHWVNVQVFKELENLVKPEHSTAGAATLRYDSTMTRVENPVMGEQLTINWLKRGRDTSLEQYIIGDLLSRCGQSAQPVAQR